ncbi:MAG TPA: hypothetical protein VJB13_00855 [Candidatus Nanoarchaeia archaeon]|nr:hypothetical protein [Candidatus Nanoarchaeia archaeon]
MKILLTAKQRGPANVLAPLARELQARGHELTIYATGNETEAAGFSGLPYQRIDPSADQYQSLVSGHDRVITGMSGYSSSDMEFIKAAIALKVPSIAAQDQNSNYVGRLGTNPEELPTLLAVMDKDCIETARKEFGGQMGEEAAKRARVIGWAAFDNYAKLRAEFTEKKREELLQKLGLNPEQPVYFHATQNAHPESAYMKKLNMSDQEKAKIFNYECSVTSLVFESASDLGVKLVVKPHPGEEYIENYTLNLANLHGFAYVPAKACNTQELMLASYAVTAGRSSCLTEAALLDRNTGGILPGELGKAWGTTGSPAITLGAIPYTYDWNDGWEIMEKLTSHNPAIAAELAKDRKKFSVDGNASKRCADLVESLK